MRAIVKSRAGLALKNLIYYVEMKYSRNDVSSSNQQIHDSEISGSHGDVNEDDCLMNSVV